MVMKFGHDLLVNPWHQAWIASNHVATNFIRLLLLIERQIRLPDDLWFVRLTVTTLCTERSIDYDVSIDGDYIGEDRSSATTTPLIDVNDYVDYVNNKKPGSKFPGITSYREATGTDSAHADDDRTIQMRRWSAQPKPAAQQSSTPDNPLSEFADYLFRNGVDKSEIIAAEAAVAGKKDMGFFPRVITRAGQQVNDFHEIGRAHV